MKRYLARLRDITAEYPDRTALVDADRSLSYSGLELETGKIYSFLKKQGVKRDDHIMVCPKRGIGSVSCILGVLKAGAAFIPLEEDYPQERVDYIKKDASCTIVLDEALYRKILATEEYREGHEEAELHDKAYIIYTSGSTGNPKGSIHEYGNIEQQASLIEERTDWREFRQGIISPFYFMATCQFVMHYTLQAFTMYILPGDIVRNIASFSQYMHENRIQGIFLSPSYVRLYKEPSPYLEEILTAGEPANGLYYPGGKPAIRNLYGMTEAGFTILETFLDKAYEIAPMGKPVLAEIDLHLEDEQGNRVEGAGTGEICFKNEYVRGYLNLPEKTKAAFVEGVFHTGDLGRRDENGMYYIVGRKDDMFKINGNRVEPVEIESAVKKITGLETVVAKGFELEGRSFICLYYLRGEAAELNLLAGKELKVDLGALADMLPRYMLPTYYIPLEEMPLSDRGKILRRLLPAPELKDMAGEYVAPTNEAERAICEMMAEILDLEKFSAASDFFRMGGDSLRSIRLLALAGERGFSFTAEELYNTRTPRKLARIARAADTGLEEKNLAAQGQDMPLLQMQSLWQDRLEEELNYPIARVQTLLKLKETVDIDRFCRAVDQVYRHHPVLLTKLVRSGSGAFVQHYAPELFVPTQVEEVTEAEMQQLVQGGGCDFDLAAGVLHHRRIFKTEQGVYFYMLFHHVLMDGTGVQLIRDNIFRAYHGEALPPDYYYYLLEQEFSEDRAAVLQEYEEKFGLENCSGRIEPDLPGPDACPQVLTETFPRQRDDENICHLAAAAMAAARCNGEDRAAIYWTYHGRDDYLRSNSAGGFVKYLPLQLEVKPGTSPVALKARVQAQTAFTLSHNRAFQGGLCKGAPLANSLIYLYQKDIFSLGKIAALAEEVPIPADRSQPMGVLLLTLVDTEGEGELTRQFVYSGGFYSEKKAAAFVRYLKESLAYLGG